MRTGLIFFWIREIAGWGLVLAGLFLLRMALLFAMDLSTPRLVEAAVVTMGALGVIRAGIMLIRISTAARIYFMDRR